MFISVHLLLVGAEAKHVIVAWLFLAHTHNCWWPLYRWSH